MLLIKLTGIILIAFAGTAFGFSVSSALHERVKIINDLISKTNSLKQYIRSGSELFHIISICFKDAEYLFISDAGVEVCSKALSKSDIALIEGFFESLGSMDTEGEYSKICLFEGLLKEIYAKSLEEYTKKSKLIKTAGISVSLALGILLL